MRITGAVSTISWIPSEAITGMLYKVPFGVRMAHYDVAPPDLLPDVREYLGNDRARFANLLRGWAEVRDGEIVDYGHSGGGQIGTTTLRLGGRGMTFAAVALPDLQRAEQLSPTAVRFEQTAGGRTGVPAPRRVSHPPFAQFSAPLAWSTLALTLHADGRHEFELAGASPFPRHWVYDGAGVLCQKSATIDYHEWSTRAFGKHTPWGDTDSPALVSEIESALERALSVQIMHGGAKPTVRRLAAGERLTTQHDKADDLFVLLDGVLRAEVDETVVAEIGPGAVLGERAVLESGTRTATLVAVTPCTVAVAARDAVETSALEQLAAGHRREES